MPDRELKLSERLAMLRARLIDLQSPEDIVPAAGDTKPIGCHQKQLTREIRAFCSGSE